MSLKENRLDFHNNVDAYKSHNKSIHAGRHKMIAKKFILLFLLGLYTSVSMALPTAKITLKVVDENGLPIKGASAGIVLEKAKGLGQGWGTNTSWVSGLTDKKGEFTGEGKTARHISFSVKKTGYYYTVGDFDDFTGVSGFLLIKKYIPWNPTIEITLKKKINPIPMYVVPLNYFDRGTKPELPMLDHFIGFDLLAGDWVAPYGLGTHEDFLIKVNIKRAISYDNHDVILTIRFSNEGDGFIEYAPDISRGKSELRLPRTAPSSGYQPVYTRRYENNPETLKNGVLGNPEYDTNYFFRIRTKLDKDGNAIGGLYGKIYGEVKLYNYTLSRKDNNPFIGFNYYLNPNDNDQNIEYGIDKNLYENLPKKLKVQNP